MQSGSYSKLLRCLPFSAQKCLRRWGTVRGRSGSRKIKLVSCACGKHDVNKNPLVFLSASPTMERTKAAYLGRVDFFIREPPRSKFFLHNGVWLVPRRHALSPSPSRLDRGRELIRREQVILTRSRRRRLGGQRRVERVHERRERELRPRLFLLGRLAARSARSGDRRGGTRSVL